MTRPDVRSDAVEDLFANLVCQSANRTATCGFCGREHWGRLHMAGMTAAELNALGEKLKASPDKYQEHVADEYVATGQLDGKLFVWGCACNALLKYQDFLWKNRSVIIEFLTIRSEAELRAAKAAAAEVMGLAPLRKG